MDSEAFLARCQELAETMDIQAKLRQDVFDTLQTDGLQPNLIFGKASNEDKPLGLELSNMSIVVWARSWKELTEEEYGQYDKFVTVSKKGKIKYIELDMPQRKVSNPCPSYNPDGPPSVNANASSKGFGTGNLGTWSGGIPLKGSDAAMEKVGGFFWFGPAQDGHIRRPLFLVAVAQLRHANLYRGDKELFEAVGIMFHKPKDLLPQPGVDESPQRGKGKILPL